MHREQFSIPQATPAYADIVRQLPSEFVGPASSEPFPIAPVGWMSSNTSVQPCSSHTNSLCPALNGVKCQASARGVGPGLYICKAEICCCSL